MKGHIRERSPGHFAIVLSIGTGKNRKLRWHSFKAPSGWRRPSAPD
jgi:hypothetical protein